MYLIVGLGNPEPEYSNTRHNMGFDVLNSLARKNKIEICKKKFDGLCGTGEIAGEKVILLKPQTYMNESGISIVQAKNFYKISNDNVIVIYDDVDIEVGKIRIREKGSANTHNGMKSVVKHLGTKEFPRIRVGIGENDKDIIQYVLEQINKYDRIEIDKGIEKATLAVEEILKTGIQTAMNKFN